MRLRKQLMFLSLITLALPWVGCQYIHEMDATLRQGQSNSLAATAQAVVARFASDPALRQGIERYAHLQSPLYVHDLREPLWHDGYSDDWFERGLIDQQHSLPNQPKLAVWQDQLHIFLKVEASSLQYFNPASETLNQSHHLLLFTNQGNYALFASAPGKFNAIQYIDNKIVNTKTLEHRIKGVWLEWAQGYQVEISLPISWAKEGIAFASYEPEQGIQYLNNSGRIMQPIIVESATLANELKVFSSAHTQLHIVTDSGHLIASSGQLKKRSKQQQHGFLEWLYALALGNRNYPQLPQHHSNGVMLDGSSMQVLTRKNALSAWYQLDDQAIVRAALPIRSKENNTIIGAIIAEQSASSLSDTTNNALNRLLAYSFLASTFAGVALVLYATWLSLRIRRLSEAASDAISDKGKINEDFPISKNGDEIGDLSRSYANLLSRLREYTDYLRTLSSTLSHELRTPLAIVLSSLDNLEHEALGEQAQTYAERARAGASRLSHILNAMSAASRVEQAIDAAEVETIDCTPFINFLVQAYQDAYPQVRFELVTQPAQQPKITGSAELLVQAFDKLIDNAADFCPANGLIEIGLKQEKNRVIFSFRNEGPLLPENMQGRLFDSMVSLRDKASPKDTPAQGTSTPKDKHHLGLGLYIVRLISDFHQGEVDGFNAPDDSGVIFEIRLPAL